MSDLVLGIIVALAVMVLSAATAVLIALAIDIARGWK